MGFFFAENGNPVLDISNQPENSDSPNQRTCISPLRPNQRWGVRGLGGGGGSKFDIDIFDKYVLLLCLGNTHAYSTLKMPFQYNIQSKKFFMQKVSIFKVDLLVLLIVYFKLDKLTE